MWNGYEARRKTRERTARPMRPGSFEERGMRVSPEEPRGGNASQFITKKNDRAFIYTVNFDTYDGREIME
ncbi:hypothetical protein [Burkholderia sp. Ax-1724]|uniref:hypothetical protein n=1 Tax=Burkholderia sp. Ax-1724 TaxID=2608336 RepID=UPI0019651A68|nr:hypothetical protein [Burkholderia sp. Ax-1724]